MQRFLWSMCFFMEMTAIGSAVLLHFRWIVSVAMLVTPVVLLVVGLAMSGRQHRREQVHVYVPVEQRVYPGQVTRVYRSEDMNIYESDGRMW